MTTPAPDATLGRRGSESSSASSSSASDKTKTYFVAPKAAYDARVYTSDSIEVGRDAVWSVSSAKHGNGVTQLRDDNDETFWQSDEALPHTIAMNFSGLTCVNKVAIRLSAAADESYTPRKLHVMCGTNAVNAIEVAAAEVENPDGWLILRLADGVASIAKFASAVAEAAEGLRKTDVATKPSETVENVGNSAVFVEPAPIKLNERALSASTITGGADTTPDPLENNVWCTYVKIVITENHQNGRDSHVRGVHIYAPAPQKKYSTLFYDSFDGLR